MEFIQSCSIDDNASNDSGKELHQRAVRFIYVVTYSQADMTKFPTHESFANEVVIYFQSTKVNVLQWVCCIEEHESNGQYFHLTLNFQKTRDGYLLKGKCKTITTSLYTFLILMLIITQHGVMLQSQINCIYKVLDTQI